jgi:hypothetical protein
MKAVGYSRRILQEGLLKLRRQALHVRLSGHGQVIAGHLARLKPTQRESPPFQARIVQYPCAYGLAGRDKLNYADGGRLRHVVPARGFIASTRGAGVG